MVGSQGRAQWVALGAMASLLVLTACNGGPATEPARDHSAKAGSGAASAAYATAAGPGANGGYRHDGPDPRDRPIPKVQGAPMWAANRQHTAEENAEYHFERDGADFGAKSVDDYVAKAHAFINKPPADVAILTRANGDRLIYDAKGNVFVVATKDGAPRTMFKPRDGAAYWEQQKEQVANGGGSRRYRERSDGGETRRYSRRGGSGDDDQG